MTRSIAVFTSANDNYIPKALMALRSFQRYHPNWSYFLIGTQEKMGQESLELIRRFSIELLEINEMHRLVKRGRYKDAYPMETFYKLRGPELLAKRGFVYSIGIDGDVFCAHPLKLEKLLGRIEGFAGRVVGNLDRTLGYKQREKNYEFDFSLRNVRDTLGIVEASLAKNLEVNSGVLFWNSNYMFKIGLFDKVIQVFNDCQGCFESDQDLLAFTIAAHHIPLTEIGDNYNFNFFEDSPKPDKKLQKRIRKGYFQDIHIVHFVFCKPWLKPVRPTAAKAYFINAWRKFVLDELGDKAYDLFDDLSFVRPISLTSRLWRRVRNFGSQIRLKF
jgi:hypothetical protein